MGGGANGDVRGAVVKLEGLIEYLEENLPDSGDD